MTKNNSYVVVVEFETESEAEEFAKNLNWNWEEAGIALYVKPYNPTFLLIDWVEVLYIKLNIFFLKIGRFLYGKKV